MSERKIANNHYPGLDVVRVIAIAGIVLMHVLANGNYDLSGFLFEKVIGTAGNFLCQLYFFDEQHVLGNFMERENILYSAIFFMAGGLIYLYRDELERLKNIRIVAVFFLAITASAYYFLSQNDLVMAVFSVAIIIFAITTDGKLGENKLIKKLSSISFEVYLSHMMIYRVLEKLKINHMFGLNAISYGVTAVLTLTGAIAFSYIAKVVLEKFIMCMKERVNHV